MDFRDVILCGQDQTSKISLGLGVKAKVFLHPSASSQDTKGRRARCPQHKLPSDRAKCGCQGEKPLWAVLWDLQMNAAWLEEGICWGVG